MSFRYFFLFLTGSLSAYTYGQYIPNTVCFQLYSGNCRAECRSHEIVKTNRHSNLCYRGKCCRHFPEIGTTPGPLWSSWSSWSDCTATCGAGFKLRQRKCLREPCSERRTDVRLCHQEECLNGNTTPSPNQTTTLKPTQTPNPTQMPTVDQPTTGHGDYCLSPRIAGNGVMNASTCDVPPWAVNIQIVTEGPDLPVCTGVLLSPNHVLTTGYCGVVVSKLTPPLPIPPPQPRGPAQSPPQEIDFEFWRVTTSYDENRQARGILNVEVLSSETVEAGPGNLAILELDGNFTFDGCVYPVCLPQRDTIFKPGQTCTVTGFETIESSTDFSGETFLQTGNVTLVSNALCKLIHSLANGPDVFPDTICTDSAADDVGICVDDSGWILMCNDGVNQQALAGLSVALSPPPCTTNTTSRFQGIVEHLDWIHETISPTL